MNLFFKNFILCGELDYFCLLCEQMLESEGDVERHLLCDSHQTLQSDTTHFPKFKSDLIFKVGDQFYCEVCNTVLPTTLKTSIHINDEKHIAQKQEKNQTIPVRSTRIVRDRNCVKILDRIIVSNREWNGIFEKQCLLCDMDLDNVETHLKETKHVINLIKSPIEFLTGVNFYRKIGGDIFYCFICKSPHPLSGLQNHWSSEAHKNKRTLSIVNNGASTSTSSFRPPPTFSDEFKQNLRKMFKFTEVTTTTANSDIKMKQKEFQSEGIDINLEKSKAVCRKCKFSPVFTVKSITEHIKMHKKAENGVPEYHMPGESSDEDEWTTDTEDDVSDQTIETPEEDYDFEYDFTFYVPHLDFQKIRARLAKLGKDNHIRLVNGGTKGYCTLCKSHISAHVKNFKQHIRGAKHNAQLELQGLQTNKRKQNVEDVDNYSSVSLKKYLRNLFFVKHLDDFWVNRKLCIDKHSFVLISRIDNKRNSDRMKCFVCKKEFTKDQSKAHCETEEHRSNLMNTNVILTFKKEFLREISPNLFHCGYCNEILHSWYSVKKHLKVPLHLYRRKQQEIVATTADDMYGAFMGNNHTIESDIKSMQESGNMLL